MQNLNPIKRSKFLRPLSRDHHHGLLLCRKIRKGFEKGIEAGRIKAYADWFYHFHLLPHFETEEKFVFPVLGSENKLIKKAKEDHKRLNFLFKSENGLQTLLFNIADELESHIRFEERILFNEIQNKANIEELQLIIQHHSGDKFKDNLSDPFWK